MNRNLYAERRIVTDEYDRVLMGDTPLDPMDFITSFKDLLEELPEDRKESITMVLEIAENEDGAGAEAVLILQYERLETDEEVVRRLELAAQHEALRKATAFSNLKHLLKEFAPDLLESDPRFTADPTAVYSDTVRDLTE